MPEELTDQDRLAQVADDVEATIDTLRAMGESLAEAQRILTAAAAVLDDAEGQGRR